MLVLKRLDDARRDGDRIYAVIRSIGTSSDGKGQAVYAPSAAGQVKALQRAYEQAGIAPETVELVEAHGTGTRVGDATELRRSKRSTARGRTARGVRSGRSNRRSGIPRPRRERPGSSRRRWRFITRCFPRRPRCERPIERLGEGQSPFYLNTEARPWLSQSRRSPPRGRQRIRLRRQQFSLRPRGSRTGEDGSRLGRRRADPRFFGRSCRTSCSSSSNRSRALPIGPRYAARHRAAAGPSSRDQSWRVLLVARRGQTDWPALAGRRSRAAGFLRPVRNGLAALCTEPARRPARRRPSFAEPARLREARISVPRAGIAVRRHAARPGLPLPADARVARSVERAPRAGRRADLEPDLSTLGLHRSRAARAGARPSRDPTSLNRRSGPSAWVCWRSSRISAFEPSSSGGHSFGELVALRAAGRLDDRSFAAWPRSAGSSWPLPARNEEAGAMLAVFAGAGRRSRRARGERSRPGHRQQECPAAVRALRARPPRSSGASSSSRPGRSRPSPIGVSRAFHSRLVAGAEASFQSVLESIDFTPSPIPVFSNTTAPALSRRSRVGSRDSGRSARPAGRIRRPGRSDVPDGGADVPRSWSRLEAHLAGSSDPRGTRPSGDGRRRLAWCVRQRV